jgi:hypothetical protein
MVDPLRYYTVLGLRYAPGLGPQHAEHERLRGPSRQTGGDRDEPVAILGDLQAARQFRYRTLGVAVSVAARHLGPVGVSARWRGGRRRPDQVTSAEPHH